MRKSVDNVNQPSAIAPDDVMEAIHRVMHLFRALQYRELQSAGNDLSHMEGKVLGFFARHPHATQTELVAHSGRDKGQLARLVGQLKERELLVAVPDEADRRVLRLALTPAGRAVHGALQRRVAMLAEQAVADLDEKQRRTLLALLRQVEANLDGAPADERRH